MSKFKIFIDGESGTTGLQIRERLANQDDIQIISIDYEKRRDIEEKKKILKDVDVTILCLPDEAAREAALIAESLGVRILDASSAHRTASDWVYGMAELAPNQRAAIKSASKVSNPGCYATGAILLLKPLIKDGIVNANNLITLNAVSGFSGGGKNMIAQYEQGDRAVVPAVGLYGLDFNHKHTAEIQKWSGLTRRPMFVPAVANYHQGMLVHSQFDLSSLKIDANELVSIFDSYYAQEPLIQVQALNSPEINYEKFLSPHGLEGKNNLEIFVYASDQWQEAMVVAKLDNLGKGASGAAVQNLNIMLGLPESQATEL